MSLFDNVLDALGSQNGSGINVGQLASHLDGGGLMDIVTKLQQGNLGDVVQSWIGTGENLAVSSAQLQAVLGSQQVSQLTSALGIDASQLASVLPSIIDHLTPHGKLPQGGIADLATQVLGSGALSNIFGKLK